MKKQLLILFLIALNIFFFLYNANSAIFSLAETKGYYAQVQKDDVYFFNQDKKPLFILPKTYYCRILKKADNDGYYYCKYINAYGYVKKSDVQCTSSCPDSPFLSSVNFRVLASQSAELRSEPERTNGALSLICTLDLYETNFILYGKTSGEEVVSKRGNTWYYCEHVGANGTKLGYVYAGLCDQVKEYNEKSLDANPIDEFAWASEENDFQQSKEINENLAFVMPNSNQMLIIICISIPLLLLLLTLFTSPKNAKFTSPKHINNKNSDKNTEKINNPKASRHIKRAEKGKDFYELK